MFSLYFINPLHQIWLAWPVKATAAARAALPVPFDLLPVLNIGRITNRVLNKGRITNGIVSLSEPLKTF